MRADCIKEHLETLKYISSSKKISDTKDIIDTICGRDVKIRELIPKKEE